MLKLRPLEDRVVVKVDEEKEKTVGGIYLPDTAKDKPVTGKVIAVGPGKVLKDGTRLQLAVKEGDRVVFGKYAGHDVKVEGQEFKIISENEILGIID